MADTYTVKKGDTLSEIAQKYKSQYGYPATVAGTYEYIKVLAEINNLTDPDYIVVGQVLKLSGSADPVAKTTTSQARIDVFGLQSNTDRTMYVTWTWSKDNTDSYQVNWYYDTGDGIWFLGSNSKVSAEDEKQSLYTAPSNAKKVKVKVKPISETYTKNNKTTSYWTASWSTEKTYDFSSNPPSIPNTPTVEIGKYTLTATVTGIDSTTTAYVSFEVVRDNGPAVYKTGKAYPKTGVASFSCTVDAGGEYKVRCRGVKSVSQSDWSDYSTAVGTIPAASSGITLLSALSETSVYIEWESVANATGYTVEFTTNKTYFDSSTEVKSMSVTVNHAEVTGLTSGEQYFFRVKATNNIGDSAWTELKSVIIGKDPSAPTTWSSTTTAITGETLNLYWVHNSEDGSSQTYAELELYIDGVKETHTIINRPDEEEKDKTSVYSIDTSSYTEGTQIQWRVRTAGITRTYGDWSTQRTVDIYAPPTLSINMIDASSNPISVLESFPFYISGLAGPNTQAPIGYHISIIANEGYTAIDNVGNEKMISAGDLVYSKYFDISTALMLEFSAYNVDLENNITYTIKCTVSMNSGLTAESSVEFKVAWTDNLYEPNAEISIDQESLTAYITPYCEDADLNPIEGVTLSVYRREFDGTFTELATGLDNMAYTSITDPHPALDYARYRIVAITNATGVVSYYDVPGVPVNANCAVIQWNEAWSSYNTVNKDAIEEPSWSGSMLKLPYNLDVSDSNSPDVALIQYQGRKHDVSYYGTQLGTSQTWNVEIDKNDVETLYTIRRLSVWMGDVYVREPSGSGYWANVTVSYSQKHDNLTIPVTLNITRVEGGI